MRRKIIEAKENLDRSSSSPRDNEILEDDAEDVGEDVDDGDRNAVSRPTYVYFKVMLILIVSMVGKKRLLHETARTLSCAKYSQSPRFISLPTRSGKDPIKLARSLSFGPGQFGRKPGTW
jgi:hypothetical protein